MKAQIITDFLARGETETFPKALQYGQIVYVSTSVGCSLYARLYEASSHALIASWQHAPINGKTALIKQCACDLNELDWKPIVALRELTPHDVIHPFVERARKAVRKANGVLLLSCPVCSDRMHKAWNSV
jgi:hypothetical protein